MSFPGHEYDRYFLSWLKKVNTSIIISSYKTNMVIPIGVTINKKTGGNILSLWRQFFARPMGLGLSADKKELWVGTAVHLWKFCYQGSAESEKEEFTDYDYSLIPRQSHVISDIDIHDLVLGANDEPYFISALFSCICTPSQTKSFKVYWKPPWVSKVSAEDRCHLNGLACRDGKPRYVTSTSQTDIRNGWREHRKNGGIVYDIVEDKVLCRGLSMPHSPRWANDKLWVLESGEGYFGYVDFDQPKEDGTYTYVRKSFIPGFLRGLSFIGNKYAVIGSSQDRHENTFSGLGIGDTLKKQGVEARCGVFIIDLKTFDVLHSLTFSDPLVEIYDVLTVEGYSRPQMEELTDENLARKFSFEMPEDQITVPNVKNSLSLQKSYSNIRPINNNNSDLTRQEWWDQTGKQIEDPVLKLESLHKFLQCRNGNLKDEYPEQLMTVRFLKENATVLELGGNIGRNSLIIASILNDSKRLVTLESNSNSIPSLEQNKVLNGFNFNIEPSALSKVSLIQKGWDSKVHEDIDNIPKEWFKVNTITYKELEAKYNLTFDTFVIDCEGAFYQILKDDKENVMKNITTVIIENDYSDIEQKNYVDSVFEEYGLKLVHTEAGGWGPCESVFYQVFTLLI